MTRIRSTLALAAALMLAVAGPSPSAAEARVPLPAVAPLRTDFPILFTATPPAALQQLQLQLLVVLASPSARVEVPSWGKVPGAPAHALAHLQPIGRSLSNPHQLVIAMQKPSMGRVVHYVSFGDAFPAIVRVSYADNPDLVDLTYFSEHGAHAANHVRRDDTHSDDTWHWPEREDPGTAGGEREAHVFSGGGTLNSAAAG